MKTGKKHNTYYVFSVVATNKLVLLMVLAPVTGIEYCLKQRNRAATNKGCPVFIDVTSYVI